MGRARVVVYEVTLTSHKNNVSFALAQTRMVGSLPLDSAAALSDAHVVTQTRVFGLGGTT